MEAHLVGPAHPLLGSTPMCATTITTTMDTPLTPPSPPLRSQTDTDTPHQSLYANGFLPLLGQRGQRVYLRVAAT